MKICFVAPGWLPIPSKGWGAVENIIWDYKRILEQLGDEIVISNDSDRNKTLEIINGCNADVCHCLFDQYIDIIPKCNSKVKIIATHYGLIRTCLNHRHEPLENWLIGTIFPQFCQPGLYNFVLDSFIKDFFIQNYKADENYIKVIPNGAREDLIQFSETPNTINSICLGKIEKRKRQYLLKDLDVKFAGFVSDDSIEKNHKNVMGEWIRERVYSDLTHNANLILLSYSEAAPLVTIEGLMAGLGLVISEAATANLDLSKPFIDVIPENKITDINYVNEVIQNNKIKSLSMRKEIREYAEKNFSLSKIVYDYRKVLQSIIPNS